MPSTSFELDPSFPVALCGMYADSWRIYYSAPNGDDCRAMIETAENEKSIDFSMLSVGVEGFEPPTLCL